MGKFAKYISECKMNVNGEDLSLIIELQDLVTLTAAQDEQDKKKSLETIISVFKDILKRSYPDEDPKAIEAFLVHNLVEFMIKFSDALGLQDKTVNTINNTKKVNEMKKRG